MVITSPTGKEYLQTTPVVAGYPVMIADKLVNLKSSTEVSDNKAYCGSWQMLTIAIRGGLEIGVDPVTYAMNNQLRLIASLWVDVAVRLPARLVFLVRCRKQTEMTDRELVQTWIEAKSFEIPAALSASAQYRALSG